jgi:HlyD family secretion protein
MADGRATAAIRRRRKDVKKWMVVLLCAAAAAAVGVWYGTRPAPIEVVVQKAVRGPVERAVANTRAGTVKACRRAKLSPSIGGQIAALPIHEGQQVAAGQLLLELWNEDLKAQVRLAEQEVASALARVRSVCARADVAQRNADRLAKLLKSDVGTEERADNALAEATALRAECEGARTDVNVRRARLAAAGANLDRTRLTAPFDGTIAEINGELFEYVTPSPVGIPTPPVVDIIGSRCFYVTAPIDEVDVAGIRTGMPVRITLDVMPARRLPGTVRRIADYVLDVEKQARTVEVEVSFSRPEDLKLLLAGYSADIEIILETRADVIRVPTVALVNGDSLYVLDETRHLLHLRHVTPGLSNWDVTEVTAGLAEGEIVVANTDAAGLKDGAAAVRLEGAR